MKKKLILLCGAISLCVGCGTNTATTESGAGTETAVEIQAETESESESESIIDGSVPVKNATPLTVTTPLDTDTMFTSRDLDSTYDLAEVTELVLADESVTIDKEGVYFVSGSLADGQIIIDVDDTTGKVQLVLDTVEINSNSSAPIYVKSADKVFVTLAEGSENVLTVNGEYVSTDENNVDGAIFSKADITFNGTGSLLIIDSYGNGIVGKDDVVFTNGAYMISSALHGLDVNDSVRIKEATLYIMSGKDGMHIENADDSSKGFFYAESGTIVIAAEQDGISTSGLLQIDEGSFEIATGGGFDTILNEITRGEGPGNIVQPTDNLPHSMKALKSEVDMIINNGYFSISSYEDAIHSNGNLTINGGVMSILSGDDAVHADAHLIINDVILEVMAAYEGLEGANLTINGGSMIINVLDDAVNVGDTGGVLTINGGEISLLASGDGVDSNGSFVMTGGLLIIDVNAVYAGGDGNIDVNEEITITGGTIIDGEGNPIDPHAGMRNSAGGRKN
ncbi:MAG: carbohydrate-binding domain-containing protein [Bacillota bacterium]